MASNRSVQFPVRDTPFSMKVKKHDRSVVMRLSGSCTMNVAAQLGENIKKLASESPRFIVLEMSTLDFIESTGLGSIVAGYLRLRRHQGEVRLVAPSEAIARLLDLTRLTQLFEVYKTVDEALASSPNS
ncbi:MAG: STAS domain-containing protein [Phycisphaerales bacterium]|nr:STAS domain-containing protein [Phycisphaerales bacterium]